MENRASYFFVGIFVFGVFFMSLGSLLWLGGYGKEESFEYYEIHTQESVAGLGVKAPVRLLGVEVGSVEDIRIDSKNELEVKIRIKVKKGTPIKKDTFATLELQGITGLKFIQLQGGSKEAQLLVGGDDAYPVIPSREGFFSSIDKQGERIFSFIETADARLKMVLSDENMHHFALLLQNLSQLSHNFNVHSKALSKNINEASKNVVLVTGDLRESLRNINEFLQKSSSKLDSYDGIRESALENLELLKNLLLDGDRLLKDLQKNPSDLLFKKSKSELGPGER